MLEDERMETLVVKAVPRIGKYFGTMVANVGLNGGNLPIEQTWLMLAGREYLPKAVLRKSYIMFDQWCFDQGIADGAGTWYRLVQDYKHAADEQAIMNAVCAAYDFIQDVRATLPDNLDHDEMDKDDPANGADPKDTAQPRGSILDLFDENPPPPPKNADKAEGDGSEGDGDGDDQGDDGDGDSSTGAGDPGDSDQSDGTGDDQKDQEGNGESQDPAKGKEDRSRPGDPDVSTGGDGAEEHIPEQPFEDLMKDQVDEWMQEMRLDADVREMARDAYTRVDTDGLPEYPNEPETMSNEAIARAKLTAIGIENALSSFVTQAAPIWHTHMETGVIDALAYRTKNAGDRDFRRHLDDHGNVGLDVHVSMLCDISTSMGYSYHNSNGQLPIHALSEALYATALACQSLHIGATYTLWSTGTGNYRVWGNGDPTPSLWPAMGGTNPNEALDDLDTHNPERAAAHLVIIFTDGAWANDFPTLQRWGTPDRTIVLVRYGQYDGAVQKDMGADSHININSVDQLPAELTRALLDVLAKGGSGW